nr:hypothetical protein [Tanacetum cinerariifolium]
MDEFDKFGAKEGESSESVFERLTMLVNLMDRNKAKKVAKNHDPLALIAHSNDSSSQSHANSSYSPQPYYATHPSSVVDYDDKYKGELQEDSQKDKLTNAMMMVELTYKPRMQAMVEMLTRMQGGKTGIKCLMQEMEVMKAIKLFSVFRKLILLQAKQMFSVTTATRKVIMLVNIKNQKFVMQIDDNAKNVPLYDTKVVSEVNASSKVHEQVSHVKRKTIIQTTDDDQIDSGIIFDDSFVEINGGTSGHDSNAHDEYHDIQRLSYKNAKRLKKAIAAQPKLYNGDSLHNANLIINSPDSEKTLEDAEESRLKMRNKMVQINYSKLNALYETFVPQQEFFAEQTYFLIPSTSNNG